MEKIMKQGYEVGKITKLNSSQKQILLNKLRYNDYSGFVESLLLLQVQYKLRSFDDRLIDYKNSEFKSYAQAFLLGLQNGSVEK